VPLHTQVVALHQERYVFPCTITVSKVSGSGADAVFMGVLKPMPAVPDVVQAWIVPAGAWQVDQHNCCSHSVTSLGSC
jgi:hypothetical protein